MADRSNLRQLTMLAHPFPPALVEQKPGGRGAYVSHDVVEQRLLDVLGGVDTELVQIVRGTASSKGEPLEGVVCGVVLRMTAVVDGERRVVEEAGDCENPSNWPHDGARMKDAMSDAYKRCAMRLGVGLHLWAQEHYYLGEKLLKADQGEA